MFFVYNFLQVVFIVAGFPLLVLLILLKKKYRTRVVNRLGFGLHKKLSQPGTIGKKVIWVHALSVGEVTSSLPLIQGIKEELNDVVIVYSASTRTGMQVAEKDIRPFVDSLIPAPLDLYPTVSKFIELIQPDLFILVETDFWPNWLWKLHRENVPAILVNGRISQSSFKNYKRFSFFFRPIFQTFVLLSMQTEQDASQMKQLGITQPKIIPLGNLKYDTHGTFTHNGSRQLTLSDLKIPEDSQVWICGSTHRGEEEIILSAFEKLAQQHEKLVVIIASRDPGRASEIKKIAESKSMETTCRTSLGEPVKTILILDTIGELARSYSIAKVAFIGGSLVKCGGHNPLEAASCKVPVLFGQHMEDFQEITEDLVRIGGGRIVNSTEELAEVVHNILSDPILFQSMSRAAGELVEKNAGVVRRHIEEISTIMNNP